MQVPCHHCSADIPVTPAQLGTSVSCPGCGEVVPLPAAATSATAGATAAALAVGATGAGGALYSASFFLSVALHTTVVLSLGYIGYGYGGSDGENWGDEVAIGVLPPDEEMLEDVDDTNNTLEEIRPSETSAGEVMNLADVEVAPVASPAEDLAVSEDPTLSVPLPGGSEIEEFDLGNISLGGAGGAAAGWDGLLQVLRRDGLDVVIVFDSTGSMGGEIRQVKSKIQRIGQTLIELVPKARVSLCTYRDHSEDYVARGISLTGQVRSLQQFLAEVTAEGGRDRPEAVFDGLKWALANNEFRPQARKVILIFGDAPPHAADMTKTLALADDFRMVEHGVISTVTCRQRAPMDEFVQIADSGGGEAFLARDEKQIVRQLMILVFGTEYRDKVIEAFDFLER